MGKIIDFHTKKEVFLNAENEGLSKVQVQLAISAKTFKYMCMLLEFISAHEKKFLKWDLRGEKYPKAEFEELFMLFSALAHKVFDQNE